MNDAVASREGAGPALMLALGAAAFGANIIFARLSGDLGVSGADLLAVRVVAVLASLIAYALATRAALSVPRGEWRALAGLGLATATVGLCYLSSVAFVPVGVAVTIFYTFPLVVLIVSPFVDGSKLTRASLAIFAMAFTGMALAIGPAAGDLDPRGLALAAIASLAAAAQFLIGARAPGGGGLATIFWIHMAILPVAAIATLASGGPPAVAALQTAMTPILAASALYVAGFILQIRGLRATQAGRAGLIFCIEPVVATLAAALALGERLRPLQYAGAALVLVAIALHLHSTPVAPETRRP